VSQIKATLLEAEAAYKRQQELHELSGGKTPSRATMETSKASVARAVADLESAEAAVAGAEAEVGAIERDLAKATIRSPVNGVVLSRSIEVGQTVAASFTAPTLFTIAEDLTTMRLFVSVVEADIGRVQPGQTATFSVDAWPGRTYTAKVKKVALGSNSEGQGGGSGGGGSGGGTAAAGGVVTYRTELEVANEDLSLRPGMTATVDISIIDKQDILVVPNAALRFDPHLAEQIGKPLETGDRTLVQNLTPSGGRRWSAMRRQFRPDADQESKSPGVWVLKEGKPERLDLTTGITDGIVTEITGGNLSEGTEVIVSIKPRTKSKS
jgi:HlyD family secretion protein